VIVDCSLGIITDRGRNIIAPKVSDLEQEEADFLQGHIDALRADAQSHDTPRGRFRPGSRLREDFERLLVCDSEQFDEISGGLVDSLAKAMRGTPKAKDCVVAVVTSGSGSSAEFISLLKLDAEIEAAHLERVRDKIRLRVFHDLLPRPGDLQKGLSWPDPRTGVSEVIVKDRNIGHAAYYFQNAFGVDASPNSLDTAKALAGVLAERLAPSDVLEALELVGDGGPAEDVIPRLQDRYPSLELGAGDSSGRGPWAGWVRPRTVRAQRKVFRADGIELRVPLDLLDRVYTVRRGGRYETHIDTSTPMTPLDLDRNGD
jgi:hypothetical protein